MNESSEHFVLNLEKNNLIFNSLKHTCLEQKYTQSAFKIHNIYVMHTIFDQKQ